MKAALLPACCAILLSAFALIGASVVFPFARHGHLQPATKFSSTDASLRDFSTHETFSTAILDTFKSLPSHTRVLILYQGTDVTGTFSAQLVGYLAWPHDVRLIPVAPPLLPPELQPNRLSSWGDAVIACGIPLPPHSPPRVIRFGDITGAFPEPVRP